MSYMKEQMIDRLNDLQEAIDFLNDECGYLDVENDADYSDEEIISIAEAKGW